MRTDAPATPPVVASLPFRQWSNVMVVLIIVIVLAAIAVPAILKARDEARRVHSKNNLKQIVLALHCYHDCYSQLPIGWDTDAKGKTKHGPWIRLVPFLFSTPIYSWVNFDFEWNDPTNEWIFQSSSIHLNNPVASQTHTSDGFFITHYAFNKQLMHQNSGLSFQQLSKPRGQVWLSGEVAANYVPWGYPWQSRYPCLPLNSTPMSVGRPTADGAFLGMADASVKWMANDADFTFNIDLPVAELSSSPPPYPDRFAINGEFKSIQFLSFSKSGPLPITTEMVQMAINQTPNASSFIAPYWSPTASETDLLKTLQHLNYLVIAEPQSEMAMQKILSLTHIRTIVCNRNVIRNDPK